MFVWLYIDSNQHSRRDKSGSSSCFGAAQEGLEQPRQQELPKDSLEELNTAESASDISSTLKEEAEAVDEAPAAQAPPEQEEPQGQQALQGQQESLSKTDKSGSSSCSGTAPQQSQELQGQQQPQEQKELQEQQEWRDQQAAPTAWPKEKEEKEQKHRRNIKEIEYHVTKQDCPRRRWYEHHLGREQLELQVLLSERDKSGSSSRPGAAQEWPRRSATL